MLGASSAIADSDSDATVKVLNAFTEGIERSQGITRAKERRVLIAKGSEHHLVGTTSLDETIVGTCFDADLRPVAARLKGEVRGRDVDETAVSAVLIQTAEEKKLKASLFYVFNVGLSEQTSNSFLVVSHAETTKKWLFRSEQGAPTPEGAVYCATEATEGRVVDVLYTSATQLTGQELGLSTLRLDASGSLAALQSQHNMTYQIKARGYKQRDAVLPNYSSLGEVLATVTPGAPFIFDVLLVAMEERAEDVALKTVRKDQSFSLPDNYTQTVELPAGDLRVDVASSTGVTVEFAQGAHDCHGSAKAAKHKLSCKSSEPVQMTVANPSFLGFGAGAANVKVTTTVTTRE